ncbi:alpha/beta hydrolase [Sulfurirhabdus autotrophica]|uniref:Alpha/beta hydrolase family protein n=1 Tax=Sulfurirhabdus autotrophica TaxID=1706046 RepID=A0A4V2W360_9PROT|nr:alpha/beta fold hydrolase [Sulfurirhabdus autotrophica]TCV90689.1 alpha/beta hydrolase family protein [Sulfurirhabdus autotrophica]
MKICIIAGLLLIGFISLSAIADTPAMGIVIMHGKGGAPTKHVVDLANDLKGKGYLVANIEMPWSGSRDYDVDVSHAEAEVESALTDLRSKGAKAVFVAGHSQGGVFTIYLARQHIVDGLIAIAPGGDVGNNTFQENLGEHVAQARKLIADGKGNEKTGFYDYEGKKGKYAINTTPVNYLNWFDPEGPMSLKRSVKEANSNIPILWIVAKNDYPALRRVNIPLFEKLPPNKLTKFYEANSDHLGAPSASLDEIVRWTVQVANAVKP